MYVYIYRKVLVIEIVFIRILRFDFVLTSSTWNENTCAREGKSPLNDVALKAHPLEPVDM